MSICNSQMDTWTYLEYATNNLYNCNPTLIERIQYDSKRTAEGPQNPDNKPGSQAFDTVYSLREEKRKRDNNEVDERLNVAKISENFLLQRRADRPI